MHKNDQLINFACGGLAGSVAKTVVAPFDRVKIQFQVGHPELLPHSGRISGVFRAIKLIYTRDGINGLFKGHSAMLLRIFPYAAINFTTHEFLVDFLYQQKPILQVSPWKRLLSGALAGATAVSLTYPLDILRARLAYDLGQNKTYSFYHLFFKEFKSLANDGRLFHGRGFRGFFQGYKATLLGILPYSGISFFTYETLKHAYLDRYNYESIEKLPAGAKLVFGMIAGSLAQTISYPFDIVRRRIQVLSLAPHLLSVHQTSRIGFIKMTSSIIADSGFKGLFRGLSINYLKVAPATGLSFLVFEFLKERAKYFRSKEWE